MIQSSRWMYSSFDVGIGFETSDDLANTAMHTVEKDLDCCALCLIRCLGVPRNVGVIHHPPGPTLA